MNVTPLAKIIGYADAECEPVDFSVAPTIAVKKAVKRAGLKLEEINFFEINEAFSATVLACAKVLNIDLKKINVYGGAVALGHPIGMSGARVVLTLVNVLK